MVEILEHHILNFRLAGVSRMLEGEIAKYVKQDTLRLSRMFTPTGDPIYPGLQTKQGRMAYARTKRALIHSYINGEYTLVKDTNPNGSHGTDPLCDLCGNRKNGTCAKQEYTPLQ